MKHILFLATLILAVSCTKVVITASPKPAPKPVVKTNPNGKVPPGQAKKVNGDQSAKKYAPGQQKKSGPSNGNGNSQGQNKQGNQGNQGNKGNNGNGKSKH